MTDMISVPAISLFGAGSSWNDLVNLVVVLFIVLSAVSNLLRRKSSRSEEDGAQTPAPPADHPALRPPPPLAPRPAARPPKPVDWQEELRRLLAGQTEAPPPIRVPPPTPLAAPPSIRPPQIRAGVAPPTSGVEAAAAGLATLRESQAAYQQARQMDEAVSERLEQRGALSQAMSVYQQASLLDQQVAVRLHAVTSRPVRPTTVVRRTVHSVEISQTRALFRHPATARQAVIAAVILGPPPGLEV
ncbi:MAG: hypothetical protein KGS61_11420 [Verrucomicrobia bacterium]|nr:hypothetical protein [Verrucomicrobiota bacterium]